MDKGNLGSPSGQSSDSGGNIQRHITGTDIEKAVAVESKKRSTVNLSKRFKFSFTWLWGGLLIAESATIAVVLILVAMGRLAMTPKSSDESVARIANVCTNKDIAEANKYIAAIGIDGLKKFKSFILDIENRDNYKKDFSCLNIISAYAMRSNDLNRLKNIKRDMNEIIQQGYYPYSNVALKYSIGVDGVEQQIKSIEGNPDVYKKIN